MSGYELSPTDNNYLTSSLVYKNLTQKSIELTLNATYCEAIPSSIPTLHLDGQGRAYLSGTILLIDDTTDGTALFTLPENIPLLVPVSSFPIVENDGANYTFNTLTLFNGTNSVDSITVDTAGKYTSIPAVETAGPGEDLVATARVKEVDGAVSVAQSGAGSYAPSDTFALVGGTVIGGHDVTGTITHTTVVSATVNAAGTSGVDGAAVVTGTTGTGTKFTANVTISGGGISSVDSIATGGDYTVNPTDITQEPVTGASLSGAKLDVKTGALTITFSDEGQYSALPSAPYTTTTSGSGTGFKLDLFWGVNDIDVANGGFGYTDASTVVFVGGGEVTPATASIVLLVNPDVPTAELSTGSSQDHLIYLDGVTFLTGSY